MFLILSLLSCKSEKDEKSAPKNYLNCIVSEYNSINDSIVSDELIEYYLNATCVSKRYYFNKQFFRREFNGDYFEYQILDSINIDLSINSQYEIVRINNWTEILNKIKSYSNQLLQNAPPEKRDNLVKFIENVALDSVAIVNKNTQDIQLYFLVLQEFNNGFSDDQMNFDHIIMDSIETIRSTDILYNNNFSSLFENVSFLPEHGTMEYRQSVVATRNVNTDKILTITHSISSVLEGNEVVKTREMNFD